MKSMNRSMKMKYRRRASLLSRHQCSNSFSALALELLLQHWSWWLVLVPDVILWWFAVIHNLDCINNGCVV